MLNIQQYLLSGKTPEDLKAELGINFKRSGEYPNLILFKYDQIDSPKAHPIVVEARGIILDESDSWKVISHPFNRFFNYGEGTAAEIDWPTARTQTKADGSLIIIYPYDNNWLISTSGTPDASGEISGILGDTWEPISGTVLWAPKSYQDCVDQLLILKDAKELLYNVQDNLKDYCFMFELIGPLNRVVVQYRWADLILLGARNLVTDQEITTVEASKLLNNRFTTIQEFNLQSVDDLVKTFENMSPLSQEGYVVVDGNFNRIKCKHPGYVALHHMKSNMSAKNIIEIARAGEIAEVTLAFPEYESVLNETKTKIDNLIIELEDTYKEIADKETQKEFALEAVKTKCSAALFSLRAKKVESIKQYINNMNVEALARLL